MRQLLLQLAQRRLRFRRSVSDNRMVVANGRIDKIQHQSISNVSTGALYSSSSSSSAVVQQSCHDRLLLTGKDDERYLTRYQIDHAQQANGLCRLVLYNDCIPCCDSANRQNCLCCVWSIVRSEVFIYILHVASLFLGAFKESASLRGGAIYLTIIDSSFETLAALLLIAVCMGNSYSGYCEVRDLIIYDQCGDRRDNPHVRVMRQWMMKFVIAGLLLMGCSLGFFLLSLVTYRLWWTILSNNVCIMVAQVFAGFYRYRVALAVTRIHEDQLKVVVGESLLLLRDAISRDDITLGDQTRPMKNIFTEAVDNSQLFARPAYIKLCSTWANVVTQDVILQLGNSTDVTQLHTPTVDTSQSAIQQDSNGHCATLF